VDGRYQSGTFRLEGWPEGDEDRGLLAEFLEAVEGDLEEAVTFCEGDVFVVEGIQQIGNDFGLRTVLAFLLEQADYLIAGEGAGNRNTV